VAAAEAIAVESYRPVGETDLVRRTIKKAAHRGGFFVSIRPGRDVRRRILTLTPIFIGPSEQPLITTADGFIEQLPPDG
jgi:hypothetical protein